MGGAERRDVAAWCEDGRQCSRTIRRPHAGDREIREAIRAEPALDQMNDVLLAGPPCETCDGYEFLAIRPEKRGRFLGNVADEKSVVLLEDCTRFGARQP